MPEPFRFPVSVFRTTPPTPSHSDSRAAAVQRQGGELRHRDTPDGVEWVGRSGHGDGIHANTLERRSLLLTLAPSFSSSDCHTDDNLPLLLHLIFTSAGS